MDRAAVCYPHGYHSGSFYPGSIMIAPKRLVFWFALVPAGLLGQPQPNVTTVTNGADYTLTVAPGSLATIFGTNLSSGVATAAGTPLPTKLNNVAVTVNGGLAPLLYVSPTQINFQVPYATSPGTATVGVANGLLSGSLRFTVAAAAPGLFQDAGNHVVAQNQDYSLNSSGNPAAAGSVLIVYLTGIGAVRPSVASGAAAPSSPLSNPTTQPVTAAIGGVNAPVQFIGLSPGFVGLAQANIQAPASLGKGDYPLTITLAGAGSTTASVSISASGSIPSPSGLLTLVSRISLPNGIGATVEPGANTTIITGYLALLGNTLYICGPPGIGIADISNPVQPNLLGEFGSTELNNNGFRCAVNTAGPKPFLVVVLAQGLNTWQLVVYDLSNPTRPVKSAVFDSPVKEEGITGLSFQSATGFFNTAEFYSDNSTKRIFRTAGDLFAVDFTNLSNPVLVSQLQSDPAQPATNLAQFKLTALLVNPTTLYISGSTASSGTPDDGLGALDIFDVSNPKNIRGVAQVPVPGTELLGPSAIYGTELLIAGNTRSNRSPGIPDFGVNGNLTVTMFDVSDPRSPKVQGNVATPFQCNFSISAASLGNGFFAIADRPPDTDQYGGSTGSPGTLMIVDGRNPSNPVVYPYASIEGLGGLAVSNGYLIVATGTGANLYKIGTP